MKEYTVTVREYDMDDYDAQEKQINAMTNQELADTIRGIARGWLPDYNFLCNEDDLYNYKLQIIMSRVAKILEGLGQ